MAYLGVQPLKGQNRKLDDISASFNGGNVTFNLATGGSSVTPATAFQLFVSVGGVLQNPGVDFTVNGSQITFTTAPAGGLSFFGLYQGDAIDSVSVSDGAITTAKLATGLTVTLGAGSASTPSITFAGDTNTGIYSPTADTLAFTEGGVEAMRIDSSGRLLVGTSTPVASDSSILQVAGGDGARPRFHRNINDNYESAIRLSKARGTGFEVVSNDDYVGVISFQGADGSALKECASIQAIIDGAPGANDMPGRLVFNTTADGASSPTERMRITSVGTVKVGTTTPPAGVHEFYWTGANRFHLFNTNATAADCFGINVSYTAAAPNGTSNEFIYCGDSALARFIVRSNGGIANYSANNVNLSDINAKKDIAPAAGTWDCLKDWEIVNFRYKDQPDDAEMNMGVIAQQVAESCPEVIAVYQEAKEATDDKPAQEERLGVKDQQMMWMAIKALQEAQLRIETLEAEVAALKGA